MTAQKVKTECPRCSGKGNVRGYAHVLGGICFKCGGAGYVLTNYVSPELQAKRDAAAKAKNDAAFANAAVRIDARIAKYSNDPRIGTESKARGRQYPATISEIYVLLEKIDSGKIGGSNADRLLSNIAR